MVVSDQKRVIRGKTGQLSLKHAAKIITLFEPIGRYPSHLRKRLYNKNMQTPLDYTVNYQDDISYYSKKKLDTFLRKPQKWSLLPPSGSLSSDVKAGLNLLGGFRDKTPQELLTEVGHLLMENRRLHFEPFLKRGDFALVRAIVQCGTMWPWAGADSQFKHVVWWVGRTTKYTLLAYGDLSNYQSSSQKPALNEEEASWYPSRNDGYAHLQKAMTSNALSYEWGDMLSDNLDGSITGLYKSCFNDGVCRNPLLDERHVVEMLFRVDCINNDTAGAEICGSPLWVRRISRPVLGTYYIGEKVEDCYPIADWHGDNWSNARWLSLRPNYLTPHYEPALPDSKQIPELDEIISLIYEYE